MAGLSTCEQESDVIETLISVVIYLIVAGLIWWAVTTILGIIPVPEPIKTVIMVLVVLCLCIYLLNVFGIAHIRLPR